jgi:hypothetical protein
MWSRFVTRRPQLLAICGGLVLSWEGMLVVQDAKVPLKLTLEWGNDQPGNLQPTGW